LEDKLDAELYQHIKYVTNQSLVMLKERGANKAVMIEIGKLGWRLFRVIQAYNAKQKNLTLNGVLAIVKQFKAIVSGSS